MKHEAVIKGHRLVFRTWNYGMKQEALRKVTSWAREPGGGLQPDVDPWAFNDQLLLRTLVEWDLMDENGRMFPITLENIHAIEPPELVDAMIEYTQRLNGLTEEERKK